MIVGHLLAAAGLLASGLLHLDLASDFDRVGDDITVGTLFRVQAVLALAVGGWLLLRRRDRVPALAALVVGAGSFVALVVSTYVSVPALGPLPELYEPIWYDRKIASAVAAAVAALAAGAVLECLQRTRRPDTVGEQRRPASG